MRGSTHTFAGVALAVIMFAPAPPLVLVGAAIAGGIGALLPDLDHPQSTISRRVWLAGASLRLVVSHRGALHSLLAMAAALLLAATVQGDWSQIALSAAVGYCSHIFLDALTVSGVPLLWPKKQKYRLLRIRTGGTGEILFAWGLLAVLVLLFRNEIGDLLSQIAARI
jgi:inner membrane protein